MEIKIKNEENNILELVDFEIFSNTGEDFIIEGELKISLGEILVNTQIKMMLSDLKEFLLNLKKSHRKCEGVSKLWDLDNRISIFFECKTSGYVYIKGFVNNQLYSAKVVYDFNIDQSYLPEIIMQTEGMLSFLKSR